MENILKKVDGDWKKKVCLEASSANAKQRIIMQIELYTVFISCNDRLRTLQLILNVTDCDYVMDSGNGLSLND